jgi:hypothetical protein
MTDPHVYTEEDAKRDLPDLEQWSNKLVGIAKRAAASEEMRLTPGPFRLMCLAFLSRQVDNVGSLIALHGHRDMTLVARSMLEGMVILMWVSKDPHERAALWKDFSFVHDWRMFRRQKREGRPVTEQDWNAVETGLKTVGPKYYSRNSLACIKKGLPLPDDPYRWNWMGLKWHEIFKDSKLTDWYERFYAPFADWHHWGAASLVQSISRGDEGIVYSSERADDTVYALLISISSLHVTIQIADRELHLRLGAELGQFRHEFEQWHETRGAKWGIPHLLP